MQMLHHIPRNDTTEPQIILIGVSDRPHCRHLQLYLNICSVYDVHFIIVLNKMVVQFNEWGQLE